MALRENAPRVGALFAGFIIALLLVLGGDILFVRIYNLLERDFVPIVYMLIMSLAMILTSLYVYYQYRFIPSFISCSLKASLMTAFAGIVLIWIVVVFEMLLYFGNRSVDPFIQHLIALPSPQFHLGLIIMLFVGPFFEELVMRGFFFEILKRRWNIEIALLITISFSLLTHYRAGIGLIHIALTNIIFTFLYLQGGLLSSILAHAFVNYYAVYFLNVD